MRQFCPKGLNSYNNYTYKAAINIDELGEILSQNHVDIIGFDACSMGAIEVAYSLKNGADYMLASMDLEPAEGWNYKMVFENLKNGGTPVEFGQAIVDAYAEFYRNWYEPDVTSITFAMYDLSAFQENEAQFLYSKIDSGAIAYLPDINYHNAMNVPWLKDFFFGYNRYHFDISFVTNNIDPNNQEFLANWKQFLNKLIIYKHLSQTNYENLTGISISVVANIQSHISNYMNLRFAQETIWGNYVQSMYNNSNK